MSKIKQAFTAIANVAKTAVSRNAHASSFHAQGSTGSIDPSTNKAAAEAYEVFSQQYKAANNSRNFPTPYADGFPAITVGAQNKPAEGNKVQAILDARREQLAAPKSEGEKVQAILSQRANEVTKGGRG